MKKALSWILPVIIPMAIAFPILKFVISFPTVSGSSMYPSYTDSQTVVCLKVQKNFQRFDVVAIDSDKLNIDLIKRVVGLPGETIQIKDGKVYVNGDLLESDIYCNELIEDPGMAADPVTLGDNEYFCIGDNRNHSSDSRVYGAFTSEDIRGKIITK